MDEAAKKSENQPEFIAREAWATSGDEITDWASLLAGGEESPLDQEQKIEMAQDGSPEGWEQEQPYEADLDDAKAGARASSLEDEVDFVDAGELERLFEERDAEVEGESGGRMWVDTPDQVPFFEHALYVEAMRALAEGKGAVVASTLRELAELYPDEPGIRDLLVRMELKSAVAQEREPRTERRQAAPVLQSMLTLLLLLTIALVGIAGFYVAYKEIAEPRVVAQQKATELAVLKLEVERRCEAGDWNGCRAKLLELQEWEPGNEEIAGRIAYAEEQKQIGDLYAEARAAQELGDMAGALALLQRLEAQQPGYRDAPVRIQNLQTMLALQQDWLEAESLVQAQDWEAATALLLDIRRRDPAFEAELVRERLFQIYDRLARQSLSQAGGSVEKLRESLIYLNGALAERPANRELSEQRTWALGYVKGADAQARGDWLEAAEQWEEVYARQPGYQGGVLEEKLQATYPNAGRQAVAEAGGSVDRLQQALIYLDRALLNAPEDEALQQERAAVIAYLEGAEAFDAGYWNQAIRRWGPLYAVQPGYQNGVLESNLKQACGASLDPDLTLCPP